MTSGIAVTGVCHVVTAAGLRGAAIGGRALLAIGGIATAGVAAAPLPTGDGTSTAHTVAAAVSFGALAVWPAFSAAGTSPAAPLLGARPSRAAAAGLVALVAIFAVSLQRDELVGLTERVAALAEALWPLLVARSVARHVTG